MPDFLQNPLVSLIIAAVSFFFLRSNSGNPWVEKIVGFIRSIFKTPADPVHSHLHTIEGRVTCARCLAEEFVKRGKGDVAKAITDALGALIDEVK